MNENIKTKNRCCVSRPLQRLVRGEVYSNGSNVYSLAILNASSSKASLFLIISSIIGLCDLCIKACVPADISHESSNNLTMET